MESILKFEQRAPTNADPKKENPRAVQAAGLNEILVLSRLYSPQVYRQVPWFLFFGSWLAYGTLYVVYVFRE